MRCIEPASGFAKIIWNCGTRLKPSREKKKEEQAGY
jgi:hypothetical protein